MKDKKSAKKIAHPPAGPVMVDDGHDRPAQDSKVAASAPTLVADADQSGKRGKEKKAAKSEKQSKPPKVDKAVKEAKEAKEAKKPLNFKVSSDFRREFKTYASAHDMKLNKLLELAFESFRKQQGD